MSAVGVSRPHGFDSLRDQIECARARGNTLEQIATALGVPVDRVRGEFRRMDKIAGHYDRDPGTVRLHPTDTEWACAARRVILEAEVGLWEKDHPGFYKTDRAVA